MNLESQGSKIEPGAGRRYWRSVEQLADTPEFREWLAREFPEGATELTDPVSRRHFVKIMSASFLLAGLGLAGTGCRRPEEHLMPFGKAPEDYTFGTSQYYATAMPTRAGAIPLIAKSCEGRPIKVEGNPLYPDGNGGTDRYTQASILNLYDPDRAQRFVKGGDTVPRDAALAALDQLAKQFAANRGEGLCLLGERKLSPSRTRLHRRLAEKYPRARWFLHEAIDTDIHRRAATQAFGQPARPVFRYDKANVIVSLDCDFIGAEDDAHNHIRRFASRRKIEKPGDPMNRLYAVESLFTLTGVNADHRLRLPASAVVQVAAALAAACGVSVGNVPRPAGVDPKWISECAKDLLANKGASLVVAGFGQPLAVHLLAHALNAVLGNVGETVELIGGTEPDAGTLGDLARALRDGEVDTLVILGCNPVYDAPADLDWAQTQRRAKTIVRLGYYEDETAAGCDWHFPLAHYLESWGDALTSDGVLVPIQPLIAPLFGGLTELEFLARLGGLAVTNAHDIVRETFAGYSDGGDEAWKQFLHDGYLPGSAATRLSASLSGVAVARAVAALNITTPAAALHGTLALRAGRAVAALNITTPARDNLEVVLHRDYRVDDGRYANNGWLQEMPDPITKITWDNAILVSRKTARELDVVNGDVVEVSLNGRTVKGPIWTQPGMADYSLGLALGYGRANAGRVGQGVGFNAYPLFTTTSGYLATGAKVRKTGEKYVIACTQDHWSMEGRGIVREANLEQFAQRPDFARAMNLPEPPVVAPLYPNPLDEARKKGHHQWGMAVDLNACVGCGTCIIACQSENNIPIVGKDQVRRGREMHWMRVDRYYAADPAKPRLPDFLRRDADEQFEEWIDEPQGVMQPMLCQHCEAAPCENVCPVNATVHDQEGLNVMVYNRCVGTRYCSNNCPYKVRRFNYLDYNKRSLQELRGPFYPTPVLHGKNGSWDLWRWWKSPTDPTAGMRPDDEWDLIKMIKNPDVTVRMRGVMEKCTYCLQRIEGAKIAQKVKAGASGDVRLKEADGTIPRTACQQACPANALVFGDVSDPDSAVSRLKRQPRNYAVLESLFTRPRTTYLARVRNPNPAMPDYREWPLSFEEFEQKNGNPFDHAKSGPGGAASAPAPAGKGEH
jgi:MoCo/4Fe-4S cofactor protein with predicted Tat translocation signal